MKKIITVVLLTVILLTSISTMCLATNLCSVNLATSKSSYNKGEEFTVDVNLADITAEKGIIAIGGVLSYDNSFSVVKMEGKNGWSSPTYNDENGKFVLDRNDYATSNETMFTITFKVEKSTNGTIKLSGITASNGKQEINVLDVSKVINVNSEQTPPPSEENRTPDTNTANNTNTNNTNTNTNKNTNTNNTNTNTNKNTNTNNTNTNTNKNTNTNNTNTNTNKNTNTSSKNSTVINSSAYDTSKSTTKIPKTGAARSVVLVVIFVLLVAGGYFLVRIEKINKRDR